MIVLGLFLLVVATGLVVVAVMDGGSTASIDVFGAGFESPLWGIFLAGVITGLIALGGLLTLVAGIRRSRDRRREIEYLRRKVAQHEREADHDKPDTELGRDWIDLGAPAARTTAPAATGNVWTPDPAPNVAGHRTHP